MLTMGNDNLQNILEVANRRVKRSKIWDSRVLVEHLWGIFFTEFNVILGHPVHVDFFKNMIFTMILFLHLHIFKPNDIRWLLGI